MFCCFLFGVGEGSAYWLLTLSDCMSLKSTMCTRQDESLDHVKPDLIVKTFDSIKTCAGFDTN